MSTLTTRLALAAGLALAATTGHAATLGVTTDAPTISGAGDVFHVPGADLSFLGLSDTGLDISAALGLTADGQLDPELAPGALLVDGALSASIIDVGYEIDPGTDGDDTLKLLLNVEGGDLSSAFGGTAFALLTGEFGTDDGFSATEFFSPARIEIGGITDIAPIPLPAGGLLLLSGLAVMTLRRAVRG